MLSKNKIKFIRSLNMKKNRDESGQFIIEGEKIVTDFIRSGWKINLLIASSSWLNKFDKKRGYNIDEIINTGPVELKKISSLKTPNNVLAVVEKPVIKISMGELKTGLSIVLETIRDPGNLGTIIRTAAWFGIKNIICSTDSVDVFNQKVIQASMGAILRVNVHYYDLEDLLKNCKTDNFPIYGTYIKGKSIYNCELKNKGLILFGNESSGISVSLGKFVTNRIMIPGYSKSSTGLDSLNVSMASAIICSEFSRRTVNHSK